MKVLKRIMDVKRSWMVIIEIGFCLLQVPQGLAAESNPFTGGAGGNTVDWYYWSPLTVVENITDLGGAYRYDYSFVNVDTSPICEFAVNTTFFAQPENKFTGHLSWASPVWCLVTGVYPEYDTRNLDSAIVGFIGTYTEPWENPDPVTAIQVNEAASGFSFTASVYDTSPKYYFYETIASGYTQTNGTGKVAAVGLTIPEPGTVLLVGLGGLAVLKKRRAAAREMN